MTGYTLRRLRPQVLASVTVLAAVTVLALVTGLQMDGAYRDSGLAGCLGGSDQGACTDPIRSWETRFDSLQILIWPLVLLPGLLGAFLGAPLVSRELESGTHRWTWTQGVSRGRWLLTQGTALCLLAVLAATAYALIAARWLDVVNTVTQSRFDPGRFDLQGVVPIGYAAFGTALGLWVGSRVARTVPAVVTTLALFVAARLAVALLVRPRLATPVTVRRELLGGFPDPLTADWVLSTRTLDRTGVVAQGEVLDLRRLADQCPELPRTGLPDPALVDGCIRKVDLHLLVTYQPADRFWTFQMLECGLFTALALVLLGLAYRRTTRALR